MSLPSKSLPIAESSPESYFNIIFAIGPCYEFGNKGQLPWPTIKEDMAHFRKITSGTSDSKKRNIVIMGKRTFESLEYKPLSNRINIIVSKTLELEAHDCFQSKNLKHALQISFHLQKLKIAERVFVIGGIKLLEESLTHPRLEYIYATTIQPVNKLVSNYSSGDPVFECDVLFKDAKIITSMNCLGQESCCTGRYELYFNTFTPHKIVPHPEQEYLNLCSKILTSGIPSDNRTDVQTLFSFGELIKIPMNKHGFPLLTTKHVSFFNVATELLFFLSGKTQTRVLSEQGNKIWDANTSREFLDKNGLDRYDIGESGPAYGHQWRHFGYEKRPNEQPEIGQGGIDQIQEVINNIKIVKLDPKNPVARRLIVSAWNPADVQKCALPPCHNMFIFNVHGDHLNIHVQMRSADLFLGVPYNIASYSLLTYMICSLTGLTPGMLVMTFSNAHIYSSHIEAVKEQLGRPVRKWPKLELLNVPGSIDEFTMENFKIIDYEPHPIIKAPMSV